MSQSRLCRLHLFPPCSEDGEVITPTSDVYDSPHAAENAFVETDLVWSERAKLQHDSVEYVSRPFENRDDNLQAIDELEHELRDMYPNADIFRGRKSVDPDPQMGPEHDVDIIIRVSNLDDEIPNIEWRFDSEFISTNNTPSLGYNNELIFPATADTVCGVDTEFGTLDWSTNVGEVNRIPLVYEDTVFIHNKENNENLGTFLDVRDGEVISQIEDLPFMHTSSRPIVQDNKLYIGDREGNIFTVTRDNLDKLCCLDGRVLHIDSTKEFLVALCKADGETGVQYGSKVYGINPVNGDVIWEYEHEKLVSTFGTNEQAVFLSDREQIFAVSIDQGTKQWELDIPAEIAERFDKLPDEFNYNKGPDSSTEDSPVSIRFTAPPVVQNGLICAPTDQGLVGIDPETGSMIWANNELERVSTQPTVGSSTVFLPQNEEVRAINTETGETRWTFQTAVEIGAVTHIDDSLLLISNGELISLDLE